MSFNIQALIFTVLIFASGLSFSDENVCSQLKISLTKHISTGINLRITNLNRNIKIRKGESCAQIAQRGNGSFCYLCLTPNNTSGNDLVIQGDFTLSEPFNPKGTQEFLRNNDPSRFETPTVAGPSRVSGYSMELKPTTPGHDGKKFYLQCTKAAADGFIDLNGKPIPALSCQEFDRSLKSKGIYLMGPKSGTQKIQETTT